MLIDILIILFAISAIVRGREIGFVRQLCSTVGFFGGLFIGAAIEPHTIQLAHNATSRSIITIITTLGSALILLSIGEIVGLQLKRHVLLKSINAIDNILGSVTSIVSLLLSVWLLSAIVLSLPFANIQRVVQSSRIVGALNKTLPSAPTFISDLGHLIDPNGFPRVFLGAEPSPVTPVTLPNLGALQAAVTADESSVVKIEGQGCGGIVEGSGFVVAPGLVATNAHVVAGISQPYVEDASGSHTAVAIWFDPNLDLAVLRVSGLSGKALQIDNSKIAAGTPAAVLGYPGGGPFTPVAAAVLDEFIATGRNIYNTGDTQRDVYEVQAKIIPGNSGGPLVNEQGQVIGVVFAESTTYRHVGYALTTSAVTGEIHQAERRNQVTGTGNCAE